MAGKKKSKEQEAAEEQAASVVGSGEKGESKAETEPKQTVPYHAVVLPVLLVVRREPDGPVVGTLSSGTEVTVTGSRNGYAQMNNGLFIRESHIKPL